MLLAMKHIGVTNLHLRHSEALGAHGNDGPKVRMYDLSAEPCCVGIRHHWSGLESRSRILWMC